MARHGSVWRPRFLPHVMQAIADLCEKGGSSTRHILDQVRTNIAHSDEQPRPRNVVTQVRRALRHGVEVGMLRQFSRGKFKLLLNNQPVKRRRAIFGHYFPKGTVQVHNEHRDHHKYKGHERPLFRQVCGTCKKGRRRRRRSCSRRRRRSCSRRRRRRRRSRRRRRRSCRRRRRSRRSRRSRRCRDSSDETPRKILRNIGVDKAQPVFDDATIPMDGDNMPSAQMRTRVKKQTPTTRDRTAYQFTGSNLPRNHGEAAPDLFNNSNNRGLQNQLNIDGQTPIGLDPSAPARTSRDPGRVPSREPVSEPGREWKRDTNRNANNNDRDRDTSSSAANNVVGDHSADGADPPEGAVVTPASKSGSETETHRKKSEEMEVIFAHNQKPDSGSGGSPGGVSSYIN